MGTKAIVLLAAVSVSVLSFAKAGDYASIGCHTGKTGSDVRAVEGILTDDVTRIDASGGVYYEVKFTPIELVRATVSDSACTFAYESGGSWGTAPWNAWEVVKREGVYQILCKPGSYVHSFSDKGDYLKSLRRRYVKTITYDKFVRRDGYFSVSADSCIIDKL